MTKVQIAVVLVCGLAAQLRAGEELIKNGEFKDGEAGWNELGSDANREVKITQVDSKPALVLTRKTAGEIKAMAVQYNLKLKPQRLYRFSVTGKGEAAAAVTIRPQCSKDPEFEKVLKAWALYTCPIGPCKEPTTESIIFDSGLKPDSAYTHISLNGNTPGSFTVTRVSLEEIGSSKPDPKEKVVLSIGDSISITSYLPFSQRVDALLAQRVGKDLPDAKVRFINVAADGEFCKEMLETRRYDKVIKENLQKVDVAIIRYGANDAKRYDDKEFKKQINTLCDNLERDYPGIKIVLGTGPYVHTNDTANKQYGGMWQAARDIAAERKFVLADVYKKFEADGTLKPVRGAGDMHPTPYGVQLAADAIYDAIRPLLK